MTTPTKAKVSGEDLFRLIGEFTNPRRLPAENDAPPVTLPSLWDELIGNTSRATGAGNAVQRSRPPVSTAVLSLIHEIRTACEQRLRTAGRNPIMKTRTVSETARKLVQARPDSTVVELWRDIPAELRAINAITSDRPTEQEGWAGRVDDWVRRTKGALGLTLPRIQLPRGTQCMDCGQAWVVVTEDGEEVKHPAVHLVWQDTGALHYVACLACGSSRWPHDLHALAEHQAKLNTEHDTLSVEPEPDPTNSSGTVASA